GSDRQGHRQRASNFPRSTHSNGCCRSREIEVTKCHQRQDRETCSCWASARKALPRSDPSTIQDEFKGMLDSTAWRQSGRRPNLALMASNAPAERSQERHTHQSRDETTRI